MITRRQISVFVRQITEQFTPEQVILFGSYAYGTPTPDSDVDLLVVMPFEGRPVDKAIQILNKVAPPFSVDLLVRNPTNLRWRLDQGDFFLREITEKGKVLYEATNFRVGRQGGGRLSQRRPRTSRA